MQPYSLSLEQRKIMQDAIKTSLQSISRIACTLDINKSSLSRLLAGRMRCTWDLNMWEQFNNVTVKDPNFLDKLALKDFLEEQSEPFDEFIKINQASLIRQEQKLNLVPKKNGIYVSQKILDDCSIYNLYVISPNCRALTPVILPEDLCILDYSEQSKKLIDSKIYAFIYNNFAYIRQFQKCQQDNLLRFNALNSDFSNFEIKDNDENLKILGRIVARIGKI